MTRKLLPVVAVTALLLCAGSPAALSQNDTQQTQTTSTEPEKPPPPAPKPKPQFFAGTLTTVDSEHIVVSRTLVGKAPETRVFLMQPTTKKNHALRPKQRVTVRYQHMPDGDVALEVMVRQPRVPRTS